MTQERLLPMRPLSGLCRKQVLFLTKSEGAGSSQNIHPQDAFAFSSIYQDYLYLLSAATGTQVFSVIASPM